MLNIKMNENSYAMHRGTAFRQTHETWHRHTVDIILLKRKIQQISVNTYYVDAK